METMPRIADENDDRLDAPIDHSERLINKASQAILFAVGLAVIMAAVVGAGLGACLLYTSPSPRDGLLSRMPSSA